MLGLPVARPSKQALPLLRCSLVASGTFSYDPKSPVPNSYKGPSSGLAGPRATVLGCSVHAGAQT